MLVTFLDEILTRDIAYMEGAMSSHTVRFGSTIEVLAKQVQVSQNLVVSRD